MNYWTVLVNLKLGILLLILNKWSMKLFTGCACKFLFYFMRMQTSPLKAQKVDFVDDVSQVTSSALHPLQTLQYRSTESTFTSIHATYFRLFPYFPRSHHSGWSHIFDLAQILDHTPFLMQSFHLSRLGSSTASTLACDPLRLDLCLLLVSTQGSFTY